MRSRFLGELQAAAYDDGVTWYLLSQLSYESEANETIIVPKGFETDFASVPQALQNVLPRWDTYGRASVLHDWLYWNQQFDRRTADGLFYEAMLATSVVAWKRWALYSAVRAFGERAWVDNHTIASEGYSRVRSDDSSNVKMWSRHTGI